MAKVFDKAIEKVDESLSKHLQELGLSPEGYYDGSLHINMPGSPVSKRGLASLRETASEAAQKRWGFKKFDPIPGLPSGRGTFMPVGYTQTPTGEEYPTKSSIESEWAVPELLKDFLVLLEGAGGKPIAPEEVFKGLIGPTGSAIGAGITRAGLKGAIDPTVMRMFAGEKAKTADLKALAKAKQMKKKNVDEEIIRQDTGWFYDTDKKWKFEISDKAAKLNKTALAILKEPDSRGSGLDLSDVISHPEIYKAYPQLEKIVFSRERSDSPAYWTRWEGDNPRINVRPIINAPTIGGKRAGVKSATMHEMQHAVQELEKFGGGGSPELLKARINLGDEIESKIFLEKKVIDDAMKDREEGRISVKKFNKLTARTRKYLNELNIVKGALSRQVYDQLQGEVEARNVQARIGLTKRQRKKTSPVETRDYPSEQIITEPFDPRTVGFSPDDWETVFSKVAQPTVERIKSQLGGLKEISKVIKNMPTNELPDSAVGEIVGAVKRGEGAIKHIKKQLAESKKKKREAWKDEAPTFEEIMERIEARKKMGIYDVPPEVKYKGLASLGEK